jgi:alcohol dehydrogenase (NADP+)
VTLTSKQVHHEAQCLPAKITVISQITHCGICGSDLHTLRSGWGESLYPCCVGHEIVGKAVRVGLKVEGGIKFGDRVGVGAQSSSCLRPDCAECADDNEQHCQNAMVGTYNSKYPGNIGKSYGGYADYWRGPSHFVFKIPDELSSEDAAPMLCAGITTCSPLMRNGAGPGKKVGIVGIGGLGHYGVMFAKALGCEKIVAISRTSAKKQDALKMGATDFIATDEDKDWATEHAGSLDLIVSTVSSPKMSFVEYLTLLRVNGQFIQVGAPEDSIPPFNAFALIAKSVKIGGSMIGSPEEIKSMLKLAVEKGVHSWSNRYSMKDANKAVVDFNAGKPRYRFVLVN